MHNKKLQMCASLVLAVATAFGFTMAVQQTACGQATTAAGTIQGTITDPSGAIVPNTPVTITNNQNGSVIKVLANGSGYYTSGPLIPGSYTISIDQAGFAPMKAGATVQIGNVTNGNLKLSLGKAITQVEVEASDVRVDTTQSEVQGVLTASQIENLPINGRNFLDLAQLEPGVQLQDGQDFDPTKAGYSSVSFNGIYGRNARLSLDGQDISDETVGTTTLNVTQGSIEEFQVGRSDLDLSNEITSSGSIIVSTKSGTNKFHGMGFYDFRDARAGFANGPGGVFDPFQRNQFGGNFGGPILRDRLFFFGSSERIKQDALNPVQLGAPFESLSGGYDGAFRDTYSAGRVDFNAPRGLHLFGRLSYEVNAADSSFGLGFARYANRDNTPGYVGGADFTTGKMTHSLRVSYLKFHNFIADASGGTLSIIPGALIRGNGGLYAGPNYLAPQATYQKDMQERYDGSVVIGRHTIRYGFSLNDINGGGLASFFGLAPYIHIKGADVNNVATDPDPTQYAAGVVEMGNGFGYFTEKPNFGLPAGGQQDWRSGIYGGDTWKASSKLTVNFGVRWDRDTGRTDSDLNPIPCSDAQTVDPSQLPCTSGNLFDSLVPGLGDTVRQPNLNFGPQGGFAYDLLGNGKTVVRGGAGIYYENSIFNNTLFDRPGKLKNGLFNAEGIICGGRNSLEVPGVGAISSFDGTSIATLCSEPISQSGPEFVKFQQYYQQATAAAGASANPNYIPVNLTDNYGDFIYAPNYQSPRAVQINVGVQRQLWNGAVLSADYLRNVVTHVSQNIDVNHVGAARYLEKDANGVPQAAMNAIAATLTQFGAASIDEAIAEGATIADFANNGLDSGNTYFGSYPASKYGLTPDTGAAFPGMNPLWGNMQVAYPIGRSVYNGLQMNYRQQLKSEVPGIASGSLEVSYAFSRFVSTGGADQFFTPGIYDQDCPTCYIGPSGLDRTHQFSAGGFFQVKKGPMVSFITHIYSSLPGNLNLEQDPNGSAGEIFRTDVSGDGTVGDLVPGTMPGAFMRQVKGNSINRLITQYNSQSANRITAAGQALVDNNLFTASQLQSLGAVTPSIETAPVNQVNNPFLRTFDGSLSYPIKLKFLGESASIEPSISVFNLFNFSYFSDVGGTLESTASLGQPAAGTSPQSANSTAGFADRDSLRVANGSGTFEQGAPRAMEFSLKLNF
jgi:hypothetical protein